jgi:pSer/pThr/pTyr-binding forkhead associated (FHA) protein
MLPELDLTKDRGSDFGVSRLHASIQASNRGVVLIDLGSTNGTLLNNYRLPPDLPYPLHNGDEIRFGRLLVHVFFET